MLDYCVEHVHKQGGAEQIQSHLPASLDRKLDYLSEAIKVGLVHSSDVDGLTTIITECHRLKMFRHILVHGRAAQVAEDGRVIIDHYRIRAATRVLNRTVYSQAQMRRHYRNTHKLMVDFDAFFRRENVAEPKS